MNDLHTFLYAIGIYNIVGGAFMFCLLHVGIAQKFSKLCELFTETYNLGNAGTLWLWWAAILNTLYGMANVAAVRWDTIAQMDLMLGNIILYSIFLVLTVVALTSKTYGRGLLFNIPLFGFWLAWAIYVYF